MRAGTFVMQKLECLVVTSLTLKMCDKDNSLCLVTAKSGEQ